MIQHEKVTDRELKELIRQKAVKLGGNSKLKIYGKLHCKSGKRMKKENRVFFYSASAAIQEGFRPCGH
jgi:methylphosphotriester-DNA--protein-cysteine methyltransferase